MIVYLLTVVTVALAMLAMAAGLFLRGSRLRGSCSGEGSGCHCEVAGVSAERRSCERFRSSRVL